MDSATAFGSSAGFVAVALPSVLWPDYNNNISSSSGGNGNWLRPLSVCATPRKWWDDSETHVCRSMYGTAD